MPIGKIILKVVEQRSNFISMITIVSALKEEIRPILEILTVKQKRKVGRGNLYLTDKFHLLRTGIGVTQSEEVIRSYLSSYKPSEIVNIGTAGSLNNNYKPGKIFAVNKIYSKADGQFVDLRLDVTKAGLNSAVLLTVDTPVMSISDREALQKRFSADLVDMEAYPLAKICTLHDLKFSSFKIVSDLADENTKDDFMANYKILSKKLADHIVKILFN